MFIAEINSNKVKTICTSLVDSINILSKSKNLDQFYANYKIYDQAWGDWNMLLSLLEKHKEAEYRGYAYSLVNKLNTNAKINAVSFDSDVKSLEEFFQLQLKVGKYFPFSANEIVAWDEQYFIIDDFLSPSVVILNRLDKL